MNTLRKFTALTLLFIASWPLVAQVAPDAASEDAEEEVIVLSPFEVSATRDTGYQATETLAGTRIRTNLRDVASAISVVTEEFLRDIGATDSATLLQYTPSAEVAGTRGTFAGLGNATGVDESGNLINPAGAQRVRGLAAADNTRDFFATDIPWDSFNVDRIDINRGANSFLFGLGSPAGIVNASTRNAEYSNRGRVDARFGSYGSARGSLDVNQVLMENTLAVRLGALWDHEQFRQSFTFEDDERLYGSVRFDPQIFSDRTWRTTIRAKFEHGEIDANRPRIIPPNDSITPFFRPTSHPFGGMNRLLHTSGSTEITGIDSGYVHNGVAVGVNAATLINPWVGATVNQQQPMWFIDGNTGALQQVYSGYINNGGRNTTGGFTGIAGGILGRAYSEQHFRLVDFNEAARRLNLPGSQFGQYRRQSLMDPTVFDFYNTLIDGPTKNEFEDWDAYNIDISQTMYDDRIALQFIYDKQNYERGGEQLLGGSPTLTMDILRNRQDFYLTNANGTTSLTNGNYGRPYTISSGGSGSTYESEREHTRSSLFAELRAADITDNSFLVKLLGKHRFNGIYSTEEFATESRGYMMHANPQDWAGFWNGNSGSTSPIGDRPPTGVIYLGGSVANQTSSSGLNIPGITQQVDLADSAVYLMDSTWQNFAAPFGDPWTVPANLAFLYPAMNTATPPAVINYTQNQNPANYVGWSTLRNINLMRYNNGQNLSLLTRSALSKRETKSYAGSVQSYLWNDAIVATFGWRYDEVQSSAVNAQANGSNRNILNLSPDSYRLPDTPAVFKDHSTAGGVVVHLNRLLEKDPLPLNVSLSYNKSNNFQVTDARRDIYGAVLGNPTGETKDYGIQLSTKDGKYSFKAIKYETTFINGNSGIADPGGIGRVISQGIRFRNVFLYDLGGYDWASRAQPQGRNTWGGSVAQGDPNGSAEPLLTAAQGRQLEDNAILVWNEIQAELTARGFFQAWGFKPQDVPLGLTRSIYEANPTANTPANTAEVFAYGATPPPNFTVTADTLSKGYEFELIANPTPNWRLAFNASRTEAVRSNVGGPVLEEYIAYIDEKLATPIGTFVDLNGVTRSFTAGDMPQFGNASLSIFANVYGPWRSNYVQMKLSEGAAAPEIREWRYSIISNYSFSDGALKGVGIGGSYRWEDQVVIGYPVIASDGTFDFSQPYNGPSEDHIDLWLSYERKLSKKLNWKIQLNIRNAFADDELIPISVQPDGQTWASVRVAPVQEWFVTNTFSF
jgi:outer membrane receptor protein involved in Fe transport